MAHAKYPDSSSVPDGVPRRPEGLASHVVLLGGLSVAALAACAKVGEDVLRHESGAFDEAVRDWALAHRSPALRRVLVAATYAGAPAVLVPASLATAAWLWRRRGLPIAAAVVTAPTVAVALFNAVKQRYARQRPAGAALLRQRTYSFPSGHATTSAAVLGTAGYVLWRERMLRGPAAVAVSTVGPAAIGASRVYLDVHWATDVLAGWSAGALVAALSATVYERVRQNTRERGEPAAGTAAVAERPHRAPRRPRSSARVRPAAATR